MASNELKNVNGELSDNYLLYPKQYISESIKIQQLLVCMLMPRFERQYSKSSFSQVNAVTEVNNVF